MKKLNLCKNITILGFLGALLFSCSNNATIEGIPATDDSAAAECRLVISVDESSARTILALDVAKEDMSYTLSGAISGGTEAEIKRWDTYKAMTNDTETLVNNAGDWTFTLNAMKNETILYSDTITKKIEAGTNSLEFSLKEVSSALSEGKGDAKVTLKFPDDADISRVEAGLLNSSDYSLVEGFGYEPLKIEKGSATYSKNGIKSGIYVLKFKLYRSDKSEINPGFRELIQIKAGRLSTSEREIDALEKLHTLTLENMGLEGVTLEGNATLTFNEQQKITLPTSGKISRTGYAFGGWYDNAGCTGDAVTEIKAGTEKDVTLWAKWTPAIVKYKVEHLKQNVNNDDYKKVDSDTETKEGKTDATTDAKAKTYSGFTAQAVAQTTIAADGSTVVQIKYNRNSYTFTFNADGGNWNGNTENKTTSGRYEESVTAPANPTKTGYTFGGWLNASGAAADLPNEFPAENKTFWANWTANTYTVKFDPNGGTGTMAAQTFTYDAEQALTANTFTKTGYTFAGWATTADGTKAHNDKANLKNLATSGEITLYAVWVANSIKITVSIVPQSDIANLTYSIDKNSVTITAEEGHTTYSWWFDNEKQKQATSKNTLTVDTTALDANLYEVMVVVDEKYSATCQIAVVK